MYLYTTSKLTLIESPNAQEGNRSKYLSIFLLSISDTKTLFVSVRVLRVEELQAVKVTAKINCIHVFIRLSLNLKYAHLIEAFSQVMVRHYISPYSAFIDQNSSLNI